MTDNKKQNTPKKQENKEDQICLLCYEKANFIGIGKCNHKPICQICIFKLRTLGGGKICPICNTFVKEIIITNQHDVNFEDFDFTKLKNFDEKSGIYCATKDSLKALRDINQVVCFAPNCEDKQPFSSISQLKKHLRERHQRFLCDVCLENKNCLLQEHTLYSKGGLDRHLKTGDVDSEGQVYFFHPFCQFCNKLLYDEERLTIHMTNHFQCHICGTEQKFKYYSDYPSLQKHFRQSHYLCEEESCLQDCFVAFKTLAQLEIHNINIHKASFFGGTFTDKADLIENQQFQQQLFGFKYADDQNYKKQSQKDDGAIRDKEGIDFEQEFLSQRKMKEKVNTIDDHQDDTFDFRDFYNNKYGYSEMGEEELFNQALTIEGYRKQKTNYKRRELNKKQLYLEDLMLIKNNFAYAIQESTFNDRLEQEKIFQNQDDWNDYHEQKKKFFKKIISAQQFFDKFINYCGQQIGYRLFPFFIRTIQNEHTANELDKLYLMEVSKLPKKIPNLINTSDTYSEFFKFFKKEMEVNLVQRIESKRLKMKKKIKVDKLRMYQFLEILRRLKPAEMTHLKYITNFGVSCEGVDYILNKIYFIQIDKIQEKINKIPTFEFTQLYLYISMCDNFLHGKNPIKEQKVVSTLIFKDFFDRHPEIVEQYCKKYNSQVSDDESNKYETVQQKKRKEFMKSIKDPFNRFDLKNTYDFPILPLQPATKEEVDKSKQPENPTATSDPKAEGKPAENATIVSANGSEKAVQEQGKQIQEQSKPVQGQEKSSLEQRKSSSQEQPKASSDANRNANVQSEESKGGQKSENLQRIDSKKQVEEPKEKKKKKQWNKDDYQDEVIDYSSTLQQKSQEILKERELLFDDEQNEIKRKEVGSSQRGNTNANSTNKEKQQEDNEVDDEEQDEDDTEKKKQHQQQEEQNQQKPKAKVIQDEDWSDDETENKIQKDELFIKEKQAFQKIQYDQLDPTKKIKKNLKNDEEFPTLLNQKQSNDPNTIQAVQAQQKEKKKKLITFEVLQDEAEQKKEQEQFQYFEEQKMNAKKMSDDYPSLVDKSGSKQGPTQNKRDQYISKQYKEIQSAHGKKTEKDNTWLQQKENPFNQNYQEQIREFPSLDNKVEQVLPRKAEDNIESEEQIKQKFKQEMNQGNQMPVQMQKEVEKEGQEKQNPSVFNEEEYMKDVSEYNQKKGKKGKKNKNNYIMIEGSFK